LACAASALFIPGGVYALDPNRRLSQYIPDQWGEGRGLPGGPVYALAQTSDGYLWIGAEGGLVRFDGLTFTSGPQALSPDPASTLHVLGLTADRQDGLWVRLRGLQLLYQGPGDFKTLLSGLQPPSTGVTVVIQANAQRNDRDLIFATPWSGLKILHGGKLESIDTNAPLPRSPVISLAKTAGGDIWLGTRDQGLVRVRGQHVTSITRGLPSLTVHSLLSGANGELLVGTENGIVRWNGTDIVRDNAFASADKVQALAMTRDRDGNTWVAAGARGLIRINGRGSSTLPSPDGGSVNAVLADREGNIWSGTTDKLQRLRDSVFATYSSTEGLPSRSNGPVYADARDRTWFAPAEGGLYFLSNGKVERAAVSGLGSDVIYSIAGGTDANNTDPDKKDDLWIGRQRGGLTHLWDKGGSLSATTYTETDGLAQDNVFAVSQSRDGSVWAGTLNGGLSRLLHGKFTSYRVADGIASNTITSILEGRDGTMWFATPQGLSSLTENSLSKSSLSKSSLSKNVWHTYRIRDNLPSENINCLLEDSTGTLWVGTTGGLALRDGSRATKDNSGFYIPPGMPASLHQQILGMAEDQSGSVWITTESHVLSVKRDRLKHASTADPLRSEDFREYQLTDGLQSLEGVKRQRSVVSDSHGRIWLSMARGLSVVDTTRLSERSVPALVHIQAISADGDPLDMRGPVHIPAGSQRVTLEYAGLSLSIPERTRFRYTLDGVDHGWSEPAAARQVIYSNLGPGSYHFRVIASNVNGVFNSSEAVLGFEVEPLLWQRSTVRAAATITLCLVLALLFRLRLQSVARQMNVRFEERLSERARIAGELHDTLLQTVQASRMIADNARLDHAGDPLRMRDAMDDISAWLAQATTEGRAALQSLRASGAQKNDLAEAFQRASEVSGVTSTMTFVLSTHGAEQELHPLVRDEVYRIGCEAIRNASRHSGASQLEVTLRYSQNFSLSVRDNGKGIAADIIANGKPGHFGLPGMQERAIRIRGMLRLLSRPDSGTELELTVPASVIFARFDRGDRSLPVKLRDFLKGKRPGL
jgi:signal transduction histidine kinase